MRAARHEFPPRAMPLSNAHTRCGLRTGWRIDAAPAPVAPGQVPPRARWQGLRHQIDPGGAERLTSQQPRKRHPPAGPQPKALECLVALDRAGRKMAAVVADQRREGVAIKPDQGAPGLARGAQQHVDEAGILRRGIIHGHNSIASSGSGRGTRNVRQLRHTLLTLRELLVAAQQVPMDERVFARIPFYDAWMIESFGVEL